MSARRRCTCCTWGRMSRGHNPVQRHSSQANESWSRKVLPFLTSTVQHDLLDTEQDQHLSKDNLSHTVMIPRYMTNELCTKASISPTTNWCSLQNVQIITSQSNYLDIPRLLPFKDLETTRHDWLKITTIDWWTCPTLWIIVFLTWSSVFSSLLKVDLGKPKKSTRSPWVSLKLAFTGHRILGPQGAVES